MALREDWGLTSKQIFSITVALLGATELLSEPAGLTRYAGQDAWLAALVGIPIGATPLLCWYALDRRLPSLTLSEQARAVLGPVLGGALMLIPMLLFVTALGGAERIVSQLISGISLPRTPPALVVALLVLPVVLVVRMGPEVLARMAEILVAVGLAVLLFFVVVSVRNLRGVNLLPVLARGWRPVLQGGILSGAFYVPTIYLLYILPFRGCSRQQAMGAAFGGLCTTASLLALTTAVSIMLFGGLTPLLNTPLLQVARTGELSEFLTHMDPLFVLAWEAMSFIKIGMFFYVLCLSLAQILGLRDYRPLTLPVGAFTIIASVTWFTSSTQVSAFATRIIPFHGPLLALPVPAILWVVAAIRGLGRHHKPHSGDKQASA